MSYYVFQENRQYAQLGNSCQTSMRCLVDNSKYLDIYDPLYNLYMTRTMQRPGPTLWNNSVWNNSGNTKNSENGNSNKCCSGK